jgi:hypothetical protein
MTVDYTSFAYETEQYFLNTSVMIENLLPQKDVRGREQLYSLLTQSFALLLDSERYNFSTEVMKSVQRTEEETESKNQRDAFDLLYVEMQFFNTRFPYYSPNIEFPSYLNEIKPADQIDTAQTVLGSIQALINRLPKWLQNIFKIIEEILSITKTFL